MTTGRAAMTALAAMTGRAATIVRGVESVRDRAAVAAGSRGVGRGGRRRARAGVRMGRPGIVLDAGNRARHRKGPLPSTTTRCSPMM
ncbi:hypothetical protein [Actinomadura rugatobispora]|uniref:Uncharacterized protein n=1 Tax=Actinomadura rugatobispora TaxID=1994 RepID=A0ABW1AGA5_9ACTN